MVRNKLDIDYFEVIYKACFIAGVFFLPFNNYVGISALGEYRSDVSALFLLIGIFFLSFSGGIKVPIYHPVFKCVLLFLAYCGLSLVFNLDTIVESYFKHTGGLNRFFRQYLSLLISSVFFFLLFYNSIIKMSSERILLVVRRTILYSLLFVSFYGFFEILFSIFHVQVAFSVLKTLDYLPFVNYAYHNAKISTVAFEPPYLAIYLITIAGWMFSYILTEKGYMRFVPTVLILILTYYSGSRTGLIIVFFQFMVLIFLLLRTPRHRNTILNFIKAGATIFLILIIFNGSKIIDSVDKKINTLNFKDNLLENVSNKSRFGMQYAALQVFKNNPIMGVGYGQLAYHARFHYPKWATKNNYEFTLYYKNPNVTSFPPAYNLYTRLLGEVGIIGTFLFLIILFTCIQRIFIFRKNTKSQSDKTLLFILFLSFLGLFINWFQFDSFRIYGFWLCLAILIKVTPVSLTSNDQ